MIFNNIFPKTKEINGITFPVYIDLSTQYKITKTIKEVNAIIEDILKKSTTIDDSIFIEEYTTEGTGLFKRKVKKSKATLLQEEIKKHNEIIKQIKIAQTKLIEDSKSIKTELLNIENTDIKDKIILECISFLNTNYTYYTETLKQKEVEQQNIIVSLQEQIKELNNNAKYNNRI